MVRLSMAARVGGGRDADHETLNASLRTLVLPITVALDATTAATFRATWASEEALASVPEPFMPKRWLAQLEHRAVHTKAENSWRAGLEAADPRRRYDIGFGTAALLATRVIADQDPAVLAFGASAATLLEDDDDRYWQTPAATCISLWATAALTTLTIERLAPVMQDDGITGHRGSRVDIDVLQALPLVLGGTGFPVTLSLADAFGAGMASLVGGDDAAADLRTLRVCSTEQIRGWRVTEGFYCVTAPCLTELTRDLVEGEGAETDHDQETGAPRAWEALHFVTSPAERDATSAIREDSRVAVINLEALSIRHEYRRNGGGEFLVSALPSVAHRAATEHDCATLAAELSRGGVEPDSDVAPALEALEAIRVSTSKRTLAYQAAQGERFDTWTYGTQLATKLLERTRDAMREREAYTETLAQVVQERLTHAAEERRRWFDGLVDVLAPIGGLAGIVGLFAALASVPDGSSLLGVIPGATAITAGVVLLGLLVGTVLATLRPSGPGWLRRAVRRRRAKQPIGLARRR